MSLRVLIAEDNVDSADTLAYLVRGWGHDVRVARNGAEALTVAFEFRPEIALVDIMMPGMDGYELARRLRQDQKDIQLIAVTGLATNEHLQRCEQAGFSTRLVKPANLDRLRELLGG